MFWFEHSVSTRAMTVEEALYLAKLAGIYSTQEIQQQIVKSPSFSPDKSPFLIENFFDTGEVDVPLESGETSQSRQVATGERNERRERRSVEHEQVQEEDDAEVVEKVNSVVHNSLSNAFNPEWTKTFWINGREWKEQSEGVGTRKRATAHAVIRRGTGQVVVNKSEDLYWHWTYYYNRMDVLQPFFLTGTAGRFDLFLAVRGSGLSGQSGAARLAVGRALAGACPSCQSDMTEDMVLYEDVRQKLPKMPGRYKTRKARQWSKR
eukprot:GHVS01005475.1.p1 GENE.GHVS01005475.1~~GHVS01005475.1.p1  ORF type:complete len:264 (+),score=25.99 GHVS01005475.1:279-1070(+)